MGEREPVFSGRSFFLAFFFCFFFQYERVSTSSLAKVAKAKKISKLLGRKFRRQQKNNNRKRKSGEAANECRRRRNKTQSKGIGICGRSLTKLIDVITRITPFPRNGNVGIAFHCRSSFQYNGNSVKLGKI